MVTLHLAKLLSDEGLGTLDSDLFWEEAPIDSDGRPLDGMWIVPRGVPLTRQNATVQAFDIFSRYANKVTGSKKLQAILSYLTDAYGEVCELPTVPPYSTDLYYNVRLIPTSGIENVGSDAQDKVVRVISGQVQFNLIEES